MDSEIRKKLMEHMPRISKITLAEYIRRIHEVDEIELPELMLEALKKLPNNKRVRFAKHRNVLTSVNVLLEQIPDSDKRKEEIVNLYQQACERL
jgi:hypothetical protein